MGVSQEKSIGSVEGAWLTSQWIRHCYEVVRGSCAFNVIGMGPSSMHEVKGDGPGVTSGLGAFARAGRYRSSLL